MPMERAVPAMVRLADSMSLVLRSGIFTLAISSTSDHRTVATLVLLGSPEPLSILAALSRRTAAGGFEAQTRRSGPRTP